MSGLSDRQVARLRAVAEWPDGTGTRYEVVEEIGRGGMGTVYRAVDGELRREVALKVLRPEIEGPDAEARLRREAQILARLEHPGIVPVHDVGRLGDGRLYYAMKLVRGLRLDAVPDLGTMGDRLRLFLRITDAVAFAQSVGVIHRDLKPANVMLGPFGEVLVLDWGVAKRLAEAEPASGALPAAGDGDTQPGTIIGTPGYMPPEQASGRGDLVDERSDVFALGGLLDFLLRGVAPQPGQGLLKAIVDKARSPDPALRYPDAAAMGRDLTRFLEGEPVEAHPERWYEAGARFYRKYRAAILLVLAYLLMRIGFLMVRRL